MVAGLPKVGELWEFDECRALGTARSSCSAIRPIPPRNESQDSRASIEAIQAAIVWHPLRVVRTNRPPRSSAASAQAA